MKRTFLLILFIASLASSASAQLSQATVSGTVYGLDGAVKSGVKIRVVRVTQAGSNINANVRLETISAVDGTWSLTLPRSSTAWFCSPNSSVISGMSSDCNRATPKTIPNASSALFQNLTTVVSFPTGGFTVYDEAVAFSNPVTTLKFTGAGVTATETTAGVATINISGGGGGGSSLTVAEADGSPSVTEVSTLSVNQAVGFTVTDQGSNNARLSLSAVPYSALNLTGAVLNADLAGSIADSKLSTISTAGKVNTSALTGTLADGLFPATLPAASGANLTSLNASNIASGTINAARLPDLSATYEPANANIQAHISSTSNPHSVTKSQVGLGSVENTALSTWGGSSNITTVGTIGTGVWNGTAIAFNKINISGTPDGTKFVRDDGSFQSIPGGGDALTSGNLGQFASTTSAQLAGVLSDETGSGGGFVRATSPTLTTPDLGTPSAVNLTNGTALPIAGITGLGSGVGTWLATPSSANLASAVTGETGSGALVFGTAPTIAGGTHTGITGLGIRSSGSGAFDLNIVNTEDLTAARNLTIAVGDAARTLTLGGNATLNGGTHSGTNTGDQTSVSGNAGTATALATARNINGVAFDGTGDITVTAAAGTLSGTTLASNVLTSSLTSVGTIGSGTWQGSVIGASYGGAGTVNGILKANGSGTVSAAASGTDYAPATSGSSILYGNGSGGFSNVIVGSGLDFTGGTLTATGGSGGSPDGSTGDYQINSGGSFAAGVLAQGSTGRLTATPAAQSSGVASYFRVVTPADTSQTASTEAIGSQFGGNTSAATVSRQWATGALTMQRENLFVAPTYGFVGSSTLATAVNLEAASPIAGTNATLTNSFAARFIASAAAHTPLVVKAAGSQSADLIRTVNSSDTNLFRVGSDGILYTASINNIGATATRIRFPNGNHIIGMVLNGVDYLYFEGNGATKLAYMGNGDVNASPAAGTLQGTGGSGSNITGGTLNFNGGQGTGTGGGGSIVFKTAPAGSSGSSLNTLVTSFTLAPDGVAYPKAYTHGTLPTPVNGNGGFVYCSDCTIASPCASGGTGAFAKRLNGAWVCN